MLTIPYLQNRNYTSIGLIKDFKQVNREADFICHSLKKSSKIIDFIFMLDISIILNEELMHLFNESKMPLFHWK